MRKIVFLSVFLVASIVFSQEVEKDVVNSNGVQNKITSVTTGMYNGTESEKAKEYYEKALAYSRNQDYKNAEKFYLKTLKEDEGFVEAYDLSLIHI